MSKDSRLVRYLMGFIVTLGTILTAIYLFKSGEKDLPNCAYLEPVSIDFFAFLGALFLIVEGLWSLHTDKATRQKQIFRMIRVLFGVGIFTMHILQFKHG